MWWHELSFHQKILCKKSKILSCLWEFWVRTPHTHILALTLRHTTIARKDLIFIITLFLEHFATIFFYFAFFLRRVLFVVPFQHSNYLFIILFLCFFCLTIVDYQRHWHPLISHVSTFSNLVLSSGVSSFSLAPGANNHNDHGHHCWNY